MNETKAHRSAPSRKGEGWILAAKTAGFTVLWLLLFGILAGLVAGGAAAGYIAALVHDEPVRPQSLIQEKIAENTITGFAYFRDDTLIGQLRTEEDRRPITYDEIPQVIIDAVLAIEDQDFFQHPGIDTAALFRAVKQQLLNESVQTGGSTITQQVARRVFLSLDQTNSRKAKEIFLALRLEQYLSKEEIITAYLNKIHYGNGSSGYNVYGIKAAAKGIFGIDDLNKLNLAQAAYLAGLPQRPSAYSAFTSKGDFKEENFKRAMDRQKLVLRQMHDQGRITDAEYEEALAFDIYSSLAKTTEKAYNTYPYLMLEVERQAAELLVLQNNPELTRQDLKKSEYAGLIEDTREELLRGGYKIKTTIDKTVYDLMRQIAEDPDNFAPDSSVKGVEQVAAVLLDHKTGAILGMIEGRDFHIEQMNFATQMTRQPGSSMKPIAAYLPAIDKGLIQPASIIDDAPVILKDGGSGYHIPKNSNGTYTGLVTARTALNKSLNSPAIKIFNEVLTIPEAWAFARKVGITTISEEDNGSQTGVLGGLKYGVSVEELTNAYGAIANKGVFNDAYMIEEIRDANDQIVYKHKPDPQRVVSEQSAYLMTDMLRTVVTSGTGTSIMSQYKNYKKIPVVGKTGTTQNYSDVWFQGYSPDITLGVWVGHEKPIHTLGSKSHGRAREIWAKIMTAVTDAKPELFPTKTFEKPDGIVSRTVSSVSGKLPTDLTRKAGKLVTDIFNSKFVPKEPDDALVEVKYVTYNGVNYLPLPETPEDMLRQSVMVVRQQPIDELMENIQAVLSKTRTPRALSYYLPADAKDSAPSKTDPRVDDGAVPSPPSNVAAEYVGGKVRVTFKPAGQADIVGYRLYRSLNGAPFQKVENSVFTGDEALFTNFVSAGNHYEYYVTSVDVAGNESAPSAKVTISGSGETGDVDPLDPGDVELPDPGADPATGGEPEAGGAVPAAPAGLSASATAIGVTLTWSANPVSDGVTHYQVWYSASADGSYKLLGSTETTQFEYVSPLAAGWYRITAVNAAGESTPSTSVEVTG